MFIQTRHAAKISGLSSKTRACESPCQDRSRMVGVASGADKALKASGREWVNQKLIEETVVRQAGNDGQP